MIDNDVLYTGCFSIMGGSKGSRRKLPGCLAALCELCISKQSELAFEKSVRRKRNKVYICMCIYIVKKSKYFSYWEENLIH